MESLLTNGSIHLVQHPHILVVTHFQFFGQRLHTCPVFSALASSGSGYKIKFHITYQITWRYRTAENPWTIRKSVTFRGTLWITHFPASPLIIAISRKALVWYFAFCVVRNTQIKFINSLGFKSKVKWFLKEDHQCTYYFQKGNPGKKFSIIPKRGFQAQ